MGLAGGNDLVLTGTTREAPGRLFVSSLTGAGLQGTNITLLRQPVDAYTAATGAKHYWPYDGQTPFGHKRSADGSGTAAGSSSQRLSTGAVVAISICAACAGLLLLGLAAWCCCGRRRPLPPPPVDAKKDVSYQNGHTPPLDVDSVHCRDQNGSQQRAMILANSHSDDSVSGRGDVEHGQGVANGGAAAAKSAGTSSSGSSAGAPAKRSSNGSLGSTAAKISSGAKRVCAAIANRSQQAHEARLRKAMLGLQSQRRASETNGGSVALSERSSMGSSSQQRTPTMWREEDGVQLLGLLGRGAFAVVYKGVWRGRMVAVKVLHLTSTDAAQQLVASCGLSRGTDTSHGSRLRQMAVTEVAMGAALKHPNIVQVYTYSLTPVGTAASAGGSQSGHLSSPGTGSRASEAGGHSALSSGGRPSSGRLGAPDLGWELRLVMEYCNQVRGRRHSGPTQPNHPQLHLPQHHPLINTGTSPMPSA